jgi:hypothetical protein
LSRGLLLGEFEWRRRNGFRSFALLLPLSRLLLPSSFLPASSPFPIRPVDAFFYPLRPRTGRRCSCDFSRTSLRFRTSGRNSIAHPLLDRKSTSPTLRRPVRDAETWLNQQGLTIADWSVDERYVFSSCLPAVPPADLTKLTPPSFLTVPSPSSTPSPTLISPTGLSASRQADQTTAPNLTERKCKRLTSQSSTERSRRSRN